MSHKSIAHTLSQKGGSWVQDWAMPSCVEGGGVMGVTWLINMHTKMAKRAGQVSQSQNAAAASGQKAPKIVDFEGGTFEKGFPLAAGAWWFGFGKEDDFVAQSNCNNKQRRRHFGHARAPNLACKCYFLGSPLLSRGFPP